MDSNCMNNGRMNACPYRSYYPPRRMDEMRRMEMPCRKEEMQQDGCSCQMKEPRRMEDKCSMREPRRQEDSCGKKESGCMKETRRSKETECPGNESRMGMGKSEMCEKADGFALAMGYVPWQFYQDTFDLGKGLQMGTIFPELCKPFCGKRGACQC